MDSTLEPRQGYVHAQLAPGYEVTLKSMSQLWSELRVFCQAQGCTRTFQMRHLFKKTIPPVDIPLFNGSLLIMRGQTQKFWQHRIPKTAKQQGPRINLTFRFIQTLAQT